MRTKKQLPAADELATPAAWSKTETGAKPSQVLRSCRLQFQNVATFEVTSVYLARTDARRYRVKVFKAASASWRSMRKATTSSKYYRRLTTTLINHVKNNSILPF